MNLDGNYGSIPFSSEEACSAIEYQPIYECLSDDELNDLSATEDPSSFLVNDSHVNNSHRGSEETRGREVASSNSTFTRISRSIRRATSSLISRSVLPVRTLLTLACFINLMNLASSSTEIPLTTETTGKEIEDWVLVKGFMSILCLIIYTSDFSHNRSGTPRFDVTSYLRNISGTNFVHSEIKDLSVVHRMTSMSAELFAQIITRNDGLNSSDKDLAASVAINRSSVIYGPDDEVNTDICPSIMEYINISNRTIIEEPTIPEDGKMTAVIVMVFVIPLMLIMSYLLHRYIQSRRQEPLFRIEVMSEEYYDRMLRPELINPSLCRTTPAEVESPSPVSTEISTLDMIELESINGEELFNEVIPRESQTDSSDQETPAGSVESLNLFQYYSHL
ncbi:hypothetical protein [Candidatus Ichthyocystis hellenicum]|uniref:hypothetical protein n=1 Tax=Candidatus Ichthyocystis hellenicum TaxID=1561003 RepID=UPI000B8474F9|nr:hypothetical protein [Candidatus Ichthyocystis hellenicum]